jgi:maltose-binding protein MalE
MEDSKAKFKTIAGVERNGVVTYGLPSTLDFPMLFYRKDLFVELGLDVPQTWDDVEDITWEFPDKQISMIVEETAAADNKLRQTVFYRLKDKYQTGISNNTVKCIVKFKEIEEPINATISF